MLAVSLLVISLLVVAAMPVAAATPKEEIIETIKEKMPITYSANYVPMAENVLKQIDVNAEQAAKVIECIEACEKVITQDKGGSLDKYTGDEINFVLEQFTEACDALNLTLKYTISQTPQHENDWVCEIYNAAGQKLADIDLDAVKKTNVPESPVNYAYVAVAVVCMLGAAAAVVFGKKLVADR